VEDGKMETTLNNPIIIEAPVGTRYLNEFMGTLPTGILNKKETGCGATSVMLENKEHVIVCCPTIQLIKSKISQYPNERCPYELCGVMKGVTVQDIEAYIQWCMGKQQPAKIMTTYDSFPKVAATIGDHLRYCKIVVDEYQELLDAAVYRNKAIKSLLRELRGYENVTYLSATPIPYDYVPEELVGLSKYEIHWPEQSRIKPCRIQTDSPFSKVFDIICQHKAGNPLVIGGQQVQEYFFFVNSVKAIKRIIKAARLKPDEVKIVCAKDEKNKLKLGEEYKIQDIPDPNKTFTFCTKTVFYGADFYSDAGLIVVVSDGHVRSTLLDISSDILQIAGRIRSVNNPFKNLILHIHSPSSVLPSHEEFEAELTERVRKAEQDIHAFDELVPKGLESVIIEKQKVNEPEAVSFYDPDTHTVKIDSLKIAHMRHKFETIDSIYTDGISLRNAYEQDGYNMEEAETWIQNIKQKVSMSGSLEPFHENYLIYREERPKMPIGKTDLAKEIEQQFPLIPQAFYLLGNSMVEKLKFDEEKIRQWVHFKSPATQSALKVELRNNFSFGESYTNKKAKRMLGEIFSKLQIELTPTAAFLRHLLKAEKVKLRNPERPKRDDGIRITKEVGICMMQIAIHEKKVA